MNKLEKALAKLSAKEQKKTKAVLTQIKLGDIASFDTKKLKGYKNVFRVRVGSIRIVYKKVDDDISLLLIDKRNDNTYKF